MTPDDMARELRAAGWFERVGGLWLRPRRAGTWQGWHDPLLTTDEAWKELARTRAQGTVTTPVVGEEE